MRCRRCGYISFRKNKKCPSCNATIPQPKKGAHSAEPALSIFATSGMAAADGAGFDNDEVGALDNDLQGGEFSENLQEDNTPSEVTDFDLDLSETGAGSESAVADVALGEPVASEAGESVDMQFDVGSESDDLHDLQVDDMGFDFDSESGSVESPADKASDDVADDLDLGSDEPKEIIADFDLESDSDTELSLDNDDSESSSEPETDSMELDLDLSIEEGSTLDMEDGPSLDDDLDLPPEK